MYPQSALNKKGQGQGQANKDNGDGNKGITKEQSASVMNNLLDELDQNDEDELVEVNQASKAQLLEAQNQPIAFSAQE